MSYFYFEKILHDVPGHEGVTFITKNEDSSENLIELSTSCSNPELFEHNFNSIISILKDKDNTNTNPNLIISFIARINNIKSRYNMLNK